MLCLSTRHCFPIGLWNVCWPHTDISQTSSVSSSSLSKYERRWVCCRPLHKHMTRGTIITHNFLIWETMKHPTSVFYDHGVWADTVTIPVLLAQLSAFIYLPGMVQSASACCFVYISKWSLCLGIQVPQGKTGFHRVRLTIYEQI